MKHIVGFSGGIDSQATALWVRNRYPNEDVILLNSPAGGNEHRITTEHIAEYSSTIHPVVVLQGKVKDIWATEGHAETKGLDGEMPLTFDGLAKIKGRFPSRRAQFCTEFLKMSPSRRWVIENFPNEEIIRYSGKRRDESSIRSHTPISVWDDYFDCQLVCPIADWTKQMCFDYVKAHGEIINPLYSLGFDRVGCSPCVNSTKEDIRNWADRSPESIDKIRAWEELRGFTFFAPCVPRMKINWIDDVVAWSRTSRGGIQFNILRSAGLERPSCESKFGLCE